MIKQRILLLDSTPQQLTPIGGVVDPLIVLSVQNIMTEGYAYIGNENVSSSDYGHKLYPAQSFTIELAPNDKLWAVGDLGVSVSVFILDIG